MFNVYAVQLQVGVLLIRFNANLPLCELIVVKLTAYSLYIVTVCLHSLYRSLDGEGCYYTHDIMS